MLGYTVREWYCATVLYAGITCIIMQKEMFIMWLNLSDWQAGLGIVRFVMDPGYALGCGMKEI